MNNLIKKRTGISLQDLESLFPGGIKYGDGLEALEGMTLFAPPVRDGHMPIVTCDVWGIIPEDVGTILDGDYGIAIRTELHCAPLVHEELGTSIRGAIRFSLGYNNTKAAINAAILAMTEISREAHKNI